MICIANKVESCCCFSKKRRGETFRNTDKGQGHVALEQDLKRI